EVSDAPFMTREETSKYTDALRDGRVEQFTFTLGPKSLITSPSYPMVMGQRGFCEIRGIAWTGNGRVQRVEVSVDGGRRWRDARLLGPALDRCGTAFTAAWDWDGKPALLLSRATDELGVTQPMPAEARRLRGAGSHYHNNAVRAWQIDADGRVTLGLRALI
ncbi:MAG: sulfite dehydrogenase, partial [Pseudomonadales bacterium]